MSNPEPASPKSLLRRLRRGGAEAASAPAPDRPQVANAGSPGRRPDPARHLVRRIGDAIPGGPTRQFTALSLLQRKLDQVPRTDGRIQLLDFGAGSGDRLPELRELIPDLSYTGIDFKVPVNSRHAGDDVRFVAYDGTRMPFDDDTFDLCFSKQVLEHVRHPDQAVGEIARVLRPGGVFAGSVSFLEPYHAESIFNWTPYGLVTVFRDHGFGEIELRPGIDGASMVLRTLFGPPAFGRSFNADSGFNHHIDVENPDDGNKLRNARKLVVTGHLCFFAIKAGPEH